MGKGTLRATFYEGWRAAPRYPRAAGVMGLAAVAVAAGTLGAGGWPDWKGYAVEIAVTVVVTIGLTAITVNKGDKGKTERPLGSFAALVCVVGVAFGAAGIAQAKDHDGWGWVAAGIVFFLFLAGSAAWFAREVMYPGTGKKWLNRRQEQGQEHHNTASPQDICELASAGRIRRDIGQIRPSMRDLSWWQKRRMPIHEFGILLVKLGQFGWMPWHKIYAEFEQFTVMFGGPRIGKTQLLARIANNAPGFLLTTSTRSDLAEWIHARRSRAQGWKPASRWQWNRIKALILRKSPLEFAEGFGRDVHVWNPTKAQSSLPNTVRWSVLSGCEDYEVAERRAEAMIPDVAGGNDEIRKWDGYARELLAIYMFAAARRKANMRKIQEWNADLPEGEGTMCRARQEIEDAIKRNNPDEDQVSILLNSVASHYSLPSKTRGSVTFTVKQALQWLASAKARDMGDAPLDAQTLDIRQAITNGESVHVIGADKLAALVPLNRCFISEVAEELEQVAKSMPDERLDPPALGCFDEAGLVARVPLHEWSAHLGGFGFCMVASFQSLSQMEATMGKGSAETTMGNANNAVVFGGGNSSEDLTRITALLGQARFKNAGEKHDAADSHHWAKALDESGVRSLRKGEALVLRQELKPVMGKAPQIWQEKGAKRTAVRPALDVAVEELAANEDTIPMSVTLPAQKVDEEVPS
jgi:type IV secretion system protein VirD4